MDLEERGLRASANRLFNRYLAPEPPDALAGLVALPLFLSLRAAIRAKVEAAGAERLEGGKRDEARAHGPPLFRSRGPVSCATSAPACRGRRALRRRQERARRCARPRDRPSARRAMAAQRPRAQGDVRVEETDRSPASAYSQRGHARRLSSVSSTRPGLRFGRGRRSSSTRPSRQPPSAAPRPARRRRSASPSPDFFSTRPWRRASSASARGARRLGRRRRSGAPADGGAARRERMGGAGGFGGLERHDGPRSSAAPGRVTRWPAPVTT